MRRIWIGILLSSLPACTSFGGSAVPTSSDDVPPFVRTCGSAVFGTPNLRNAITIGPLVLVGVPQAAGLDRRAFEPHDGRFQAIKVLAVVPGPADVTVTVPSSQRGSVALLYDPAARANRYGFRFSSGDPRVTFASCGGTETQYNGGFLATRPVCVRLEVESESRRAEGWLSLGGRSLVSDPIRRVTGGATVSRPGTSARARPGALGGGRPGPG
jgi:hypothetical protein